MLNGILDILTIATGVIMEYQILRLLVLLMFAVLVVNLCVRIINVGRKM